MMLYFLVFISSFFVFVRTVPIEQSDSTTTFSTDKLPSNGTSLDFRILPYIGNGHVATVVYSDFIYMNGLCNGENSSSHRARIPSTINWKFKMNFTSSLYTLNVSSGIFIETLENEEVRVERRLFASQEYSELLVAHVVLTRKIPVGNKIFVPVEVNEQVTSVDIDFTVETRNPQYVLLFGKTREIENNQFQKEPLPVYVYYTPLPFQGLELDENETIRTSLFVTSIDQNETIAKQSFDYASITEQADVVLSSHISRWNDVWSNGRIDIEGDDELQRQINSAFYYILSSLPPLSTKSIPKQFYGLSPGSLAWGGQKGESYSGRSFWDAEIWIYPSVLLFYPTLAKEILSYRIALRDAAAYNARLTGYEGWRFPWQCARTGVDLTSDFYTSERLYEIHITGDIAFAAGQYFAATGNQDWLLNEFGGELIYQTALFWSSRATYNQIKRQYEILTVLPPDEDALPFKNNSVFTNAIASINIQLAKSISSITNKTIPQKWLDIASNLYFPFDNLTQTYLEYEGFNLNNTIVKQADVVLIIFPLMWPMTDEIKRNSLLTYERITRKDGPAMTWSIHSIGFLDSSDFDKGDQNFRRSYASYVRSPFNVWTETQSGIGAVNFITGIGGFLQAVIFGYGGIRLKFDQLQLKPSGHLPDQATKFIYHGIKYQGVVLDLTVDNTTYEVYVREQNINNYIPLVYEHTEHRGLLKFNDRLSFPIDTQLIIRRSVPLYS